MGYACNTHAEENGYTIVREIGGHGCGVHFHEDPWINHIGVPDSGLLFVPGMTFTIEPMVNMGKPDVYQDEEDGLDHLHAGRQAFRPVGVHHPCDGKTERRYSLTNRRARS